jgi:CRISPR-associated protein Csd1
VIIQALVKRYEDTQDVPVGWKKREVTHALEISEAGELLHVRDMRERKEIETGNKKKTVIQKRSMTLPTSEVRSSGVRGAFLCDDASYIFGLDEKRGEAKFSANKELHHHILEHVQTPSATAIKSWYSLGVKPEHIELLKEFIPNEKELAHAVFVFQVNGRCVDFYDLAVRDSWNSHCSANSQNKNDEIRCLITGKKDTPERIHDKIKLRGGQPAGSNLVSANEDSFASYGKTKKDRAADIGKYAAFAHVTALNDLLKNEEHRKFIGGDTLVYWAEGNNKAETNAFNSVLDIKPAATDDENLNDIMKKSTSLQHFNFNDCDMNRPFYLLCLSPNAARVSVRFFYTTSFGDIIKNLQAHYENLNIISDNSTKFTHLPLWIILNETTVTKEASKVVPLLGGQLVRSILKGTAYPQTLLNAMLARIRAGEPVNQTKAAVIKAVLIKNFNEKEVAVVTLNEQTNNKPYVLGRLFAALESLQNRAAGGSLNSTIRDRYFASACANPKNVFPTVLKLSMHHAAKLENSVFHEKLKGELLAKLDAENPFPSTLGLEDQGKFILGYYHQRQKFFTKSEEDKNNA